MKNLNTALGVILNTAFKRAFPLQDVLTIQFCAKEKQGDFQCVDTVKIFNQNKKDGEVFGAKNPRSFTEDILTHVEENEYFDVQKGVSITGPGFINIFLKDEYLSKSFNETFLHPKIIEAKPLGKVVIDYSSPNIAKEMHVGHLRSTILGDCIARLLELLGYEVMRVNHVGDWGTSFGMLIAYIKKFRPELKEDIPSVAELMKIYKESKKEFDADPEFKKTAQNEVVKLQAGDAECNQIWRAIVDRSEAEFKQVYKRLNVHPDLTTYGESYYNPKLGPLCDRLQDEGHAVISEEALVINVEDCEIPVMIRKKDGGYGYGTTDMCAIDTRANEWKADWLIYVVGTEQDLHFKSIFSCARKCNILQEGIRVDHTGFGMLLGKDGKKFKTRSGETVVLRELLDEARDRARLSLEARFNADEENKTSKLSEEEFAVSSEILGCSSVKYYDIKQNRTTSYKFDYEKMLDPRGNTAVYLIYTNVRINSIWRKCVESSGCSEEEMMRQLEQVAFVVDSNSQRVLVVKVLQFKDVLDSVLVDLMPHKLTDYLYDLCTKVSEYYTNKDNKILNSEQMLPRLKLLMTVQRIMTVCFELTGLQTLDRI